MSRTSYSLTETSVSALNYRRSSRRPMAWVFLSVGLVLLGLAFTSCGDALIGIVRGDAFYRGRPTGYWRQNVTNWNALLQSASGGPVFLNGPAARQSAPGAFRAWLDGWFRPNRFLVPRGNDPRALPVLHDLLHDPDPDVVRFAQLELGLPTTHPAP